MSTEFVIAIAAYPGVDLLDVAAPHEVFSWLASTAASGPNTQKYGVYVVAESMTPIKANHGLVITPDLTFDMLSRVDLLWIPGGDPDALVVQMANPRYVTFIRSRSESARYVTSVCEGALIAANAGLLDGYEATTHWAFVECLRHFYPKVKVAAGYPRFVKDRNRVTGGGISSGLDESLYLVKLIAGQEAAEQVQLTIQYFPQPPVSAQIPESNPCRLARQAPG